MHLPSTTSIICIPTQFLSHIHKHQTITTPLHRFQKCHTKTGVSEVSRPLHLSATITTRHPPLAHHSIQSVPAQQHLHTSPLVHPLKHQYGLSNSPASRLLPLQYDPQTLFQKQHHESTPRPAQPARSPTAVRSIFQIHLAGGHGAAISVHAATISVPLDAV